MGLLLWLGVLGCGQPPAGESVPAPLLLARHAELVSSLELPEGSWGDAVGLPESVPVQGPFRPIRTVGGVTTWESPIPIRPRNLFFSKAPPGMKLQQSNRDLRFADGSRGSKKVASWGFTGESLHIRRKAETGPPKVGEYSLTYPRAREREESLNFKLSGLEAEEFVLRSLQLGSSTRHGLFLPAPASVVFDVEVPAGARLDMDAVVLPPELQDGRVSDGAVLSIEIEDGSGWRVVDEVSLSVGAWDKVGVDLPEVTGGKAKLRFSTAGAQSDIFDYVFLAEPTLYVPTSSPRRVLMVFIDTLRPDHMGFYGYKRDTTPKLDVWASQAHVFENARSVAPWTLPSARTAFSGHQPEAWGSVSTVQEELSGAGWATGAFVGNIYLSTNFDMSSGWSHHSVINWPVAKIQVREVERFLRRNKDRDAVAMLHLMDMHLPYEEPFRYRNIWAEKAPAGLSDMALRVSILKAEREESEAVRTWLQARYDQNLRYLDDTLSRLFESLGEDVPVVIFSDHGEEFWDHEGFEHGHTLYDELLRVPFVVRAPGVTPGRSAEPVSLLDLSPTIMDLVGLDYSQMEGRSVLPLAAGDEAAQKAMRERDLSVGRPLYGDERWGVIASDTKWMTHAGKEEVYDLSQDPGEHSNLVKEAQLGVLRERMGAALDRPAPVSWRLKASTTSGSPVQDVVVRVRHPDGFARAWLGADPILKSDVELTFSESEVVITYKTGARGTREVFIEPKGEVVSFGELSLVATETDSEKTIEARKGLVGKSVSDGVQHTLLRGRAHGRSFTVTYAQSPAPGEGTREIRAFDSEVFEELKALGYVE